MALLLTKSSVKRKREVIEEASNTCILCEKTCSENRSKYPLEKWKNLKDIAEKWKGLDMFSEVFDNVNFDKAVLSLKQR